MTADPRKSHTVMWFPHQDEREVKQVSCPSRWVQVGRYVSTGGYKAHSTFCCLCEG